jgi:hypothetical protein
MKKQLDSVNKETNARIDKVVNRAEQLTANIAKVVDDRVSEITFNLTSHRDNTAEEVLELENEVKEIISNLNKEAKEWKNGASCKVSNELKQRETQKSRLDRFDIEISSTKERLSDGASVVCNVSSLQNADGNLQGNAGEQTCGPATLDTCNNNATNSNGLTSVNVNHVPYRVDGYSVYSNDNVDVRIPQMYGESNFIAQSDKNLPHLMTALESTQCFISGSLKNI